MNNRVISLFLLAVVLAILIVTKDDPAEKWNNISDYVEIKSQDDFFETKTEARLITNCIVIINKAIVAGIFYPYYIATACEDVQMVVLHESFKNIKQFPRGSIDNRTDVRYNNTIAILVRAVNGGDKNGRIQKINNRHG